jgi:predicted RNase H-like HicB family nuclease
VEIEEARTVDEVVQTPHRHGRLEIKARESLHRWTAHNARLLEVMRAIMVVDMKLRLVVEYDPGTDRWSAVFPELPGCGSAGDTEEEAIRNAREAMELWFEPSLEPLAKGAQFVEFALP